MKTDPNEPIMPHTQWANVPTYGLTKREYFAALAMQGYIAGVRASGDGINIKELCASATWIADALINELNKDNANKTGK